MRRETRSGDSQRRTPRDDGHRPRKVLQRVSTAGGWIPALPADGPQGQVRATHGIFSARVTAITGRVVALGCGVAVTPLVVRSLGAQKYGLYITVVTVTLIVTAAMYGVGNGLVRIVASDRVEFGGSALSQIAGSALVAYCSISAIALALFLGTTISMHPDWNGILGLRGVAQHDDSLAFLALSVVLLELPLQACGAIRLGLQESYITNLFTAGAAVFQLLGALFVAKTHPTLFRFVLVEVGVPLIADAANTALMLLRGPTGGALRLRASVSRIKEILRSGGAYSLIALSGVAGFQTDVFVIAHMLGPTAVSRYSIPLLAYAILPSLAMLYLGPLLPSYANALAREDEAWVALTFRRTFRQVMVGVIVFCIVAGVTIRPAIDIVVSHQLQPPLSLILAFSGYALVMTAGLGPNTLIAARGQIRLQLFAAVGMALLNLPASILLTRLLGLPGPLLGTIVSQTCLGLLPYFFLRRRWLGPPPSSRSSHIDR